MKFSMKTQRVLKTLDEKTFEWIENEKKKTVPGHPPLPNVERQRYHHIRNVALKEIENLTRLAECLPEGQQSQIFNDKKLWPFLKALLNFPASYEVSREKDEIIYTPEAEERRQRLLQLCYDIIGLLDNSGFAQLLAPTVWDVTIKERGALPFLRAIYYQSLIGDKRISIRKKA